MDKMSKEKHEMALEIESLKGEVDGMRKRLKEGAD